MSYRNLEVWQLARQLSIDTHKMTLTKLPKFEQFEEASQIRRETGSLADRTLYEELHARMTTLGKKLNLFLQSVEAGHRSEK